MRGEAGPSPIDIHRIFSATEHGQTLAGQVRYDRYKPAEVSNERWIEILGADVNNLSHLPLTLGLTRDMIRNLHIHQPDFLDECEEQMLCTAAIVHDWAEAVVGDITYSEKTEQDETEEKSQLLAMLDQFGVHGSGVQEFIKQASDEVVFSPESKLGLVFNSVERVGYMRTALRASLHVMAGKALDCDEGLRWLVADVLGNHVPTLIERTAVHKPVFGYLANTRSGIDQAFSVVRPEIFNLYGPEKCKEKEDKFNNAHEIFLNWRDKHGL